MLIEHNVLGLKIGSLFQGYAEGPLAIGALLAVIALLIYRRLE